MMCSRYHERVTSVDGVNIKKRECVFVLIYFFRGDGSRCDVAKKTVVHGV